MENMEDLWAAKRGLISPEEVRKITVGDALVDTGATGLSLPHRVIEQLGLLPIRPGRRQLIGNPAHGSEHRIELM